MRELQLRLLGGFEARLASGESVTFPRRKAQVLLAFLALHADRVHPRDKLATLLWGDVPDDRARHSLRQALLTIRHALAGTAAGCVVEHGDGVAVDPAHVEVDVTVFQSLAAQTTGEALEQAAGLYRGDLLEGIRIAEGPFEDWLRTERARLHELAVEVLARLLGHQDRTGAVDHAVRTAIRLLGLDPIQESVHRVLMRLHVRQGRPAAALQQYQDCVDVLERELGAAPEAETRRLYQEVLRTLSRPSVAVPLPPSRSAPVRPVPFEPSTLGAPLVGRDTEIGRLGLALQGVRQGQGTTALIGGEAGIGKTRLIEALIAQALAAGDRVLLGRAHENEQVLPLGPWIDAFRAGGAVASLETLDAPWRAELGRLFPEVGALHRPHAAAEDYVRLFEAVARAVDHLALAGPLVLVLEDLHWADEMSLRMLVFLARRIAEWPVLVAVTYRVEEMVDATLLKRSLEQLGRMSGSVSLTLSALSPADTLTLIRTLARTGTADAVVDRLGDRIWQASEGNPFMVVEMVRGFDPTRAPDPTASPRTPPTVLELVAGRLDRVSDVARRLVAVASVVGREFELGLLQRAAAADEVDVVQGVEELVGRRILHAVGERLDFTHDRIREVAYERLLPQARRLLHGAVARALEALHAADLAPHALALGHHYHAAEVWDRAFDHLAQAATWAAARAAHREAIASWELALEALGRLSTSPARTEQSIDLRFELRHSCVPLADHPRILVHLQAAEAAARSIGDSTRLGWTLAYRTHGLYLAGDSRTATETGERALALAAELDDPVLEEWANVYVAQVYHWIGRYREGIERLRRNLGPLEARLVQRGVSSKQFVNTRMFLAWCLAEVGEFVEARARAEEAIAAAQASDSAYWLVHAHCGAALADLRRGAVDEAIAGATRALDLCRGRDYFVLWGIPATILGAATALAGRPAEGIRLLERAADITGVLAAPVLAFLGQAYLAADRAADGHAVACRALALTEQNGERGWEAWSRFLLAEATAREGTPEAALVAYREALAVAQALGMQPLVAHCHRGLGGVQRAAGKPLAADEHETTAVTLYRRMGMAHWPVRW